MSNENEQQMPEGFRILRDHKVDVFKSSILGSTIGTLCDAGLNDLEVLTVISDYLRIIRAACNDPKMLENLANGAEIIKRAADNQS